MHRLMAAIPGLKRWDARLFGASTEDPILAAMNLPTFAQAKDAPAASMDRRELGPESH